MSTSTLANCPTCGGFRNADILAEEEHYKPGDDFMEPLWTRTRYLILACRGCDTRFFVTVSSNADDLTDERGKDGNKTGKQIPQETVRYYPSFSNRTRPEWSKGAWTKEQKLRDIVDEMYGAFNNELPVLAAVAMRTVFDTAIEILGIDPGGTFKEKLDAILAVGKISQEERNHLDALIDAGSAAAHRGWRPEPWHLDSMALILEGFLHRTFVLPGRATFLRDVPSKSPRSK